MIAFLLERRVDLLERRVEDLDRAGVLMARLLDAGDDLTAKDAQEARTFLDKL